MRILHLVSCRGWSSDAYWAARVCRELERRGHDVTLGCRRGTDAAVIDRARAEGVKAIETFEFAGGVRLASDAADLRRLARALLNADVVHVHRGKEHWLAVAAARLGGRPRPIVRTRHIAQAVRPHAANRWLYRRATALVVTVSDAIRQQYLAAGLLPPDRVIALPGGADAEAYRPRAADAAVRAALGGGGGVPLIGLVSGLRVMKGHQVVIDAAARLVAAGRRLRFVFVGRGTREAVVREAVRQAGLDPHVTIAGWAPDLPAVMAALDIALYAALESDGMSRVVFEYLAAGKPLVAARTGVVPEVLTDGTHALLVPAGDADALAEALARLLDDEALRTRLGTAGHRRLVEHYSGARVAEALEAQYARLVA